MPHNSRLFFFCLLQLCFFCSNAQNQHLQFDHISASEGLSLNNVEAIIQDNRGFMWFGTPDGLNKYDGYRFTVFKTDPADTSSISNNYIRSIAKSKNGDLWVATMGGGVCLYDHNKERFIRYRHNAKNGNSIADDNVNSIWEDENENVWIGTVNGLDLLNRKQNHIEHFKKINGDTSSLTDNYIRCVFEDTRHNLWVATLNGGVNLFNKNNRTFTHYLHDEKNTLSIAGNNIITLFEDSEKRLWIGTDGAGMDYFDRQTGIFHHYKKDESNPHSLQANAVYAFSEDDEKNLWIGTENGGLSLLNFERGSMITYKNDAVDGGSISNNSINALFRDAKKNMWLGNYSGGIDMVNSDKGSFFHYKHKLEKNSLSNNNVLSIFEDSKFNIWIGTDGGGLNLFDAQSGHFSYFKHARDNSQSICGDYVISVTEDSKENIWVGCWASGVTVYNPVKKTYRHYIHNPGDTTSLSSNNVWKIFEDRDKNIWIGTYGGGLNLLNADGKTFTHFPYNPNDPNGISNENIQNIFQDRDGNIWISTDGGGLNLFNKQTLTFRHFLHHDTKNSISNNNVYSIFEDQNGTLWICTRNGLNLYDKKTNRFSLLTVADGLPANLTLAVLEDNKRNYWISTNKGISRFNPFSRVFTNYKVSDGLQSDEFKEQAFCRSHTGMMYFGGVNGFNEFNPDSITTIAYDPPLLITNFQIFNKKVPIATNESQQSPLKKSITETDFITLPSSSSVFSFEFASLNYTSSDKKKYAYMLEGFDKEWNESGKERLATYTHLDPGEYTFKVRGLNNEGKWSPKIVSLKLLIKPPFYLTWWFKLLALVVLSGSIVALYLNRVSSIKKQQEKLQQQVDEKTMQLVLANNDLTMKNKELEQFAYVASHDLQEPLRTTTGFVNLLQQQYKGKIDERADKYLSFLSEASNRMRVLIADLLDFSRIGEKREFERINCNEILKTVKQDIMAAVTETNAVIEADTLPVINGHAFEMQILFQNLILNAIKFRKKNMVPHITISVSKAQKYWQFAFRDNGIGIEAQYTERIFDIFQRLHTRAEYEGSGIGLSHCKKIVELHYGKIWVESIPGEGSTFYFTIPDARPAA
ncbi:MAG: response regulator [Ferruginibacter sp.]|uniref:two-component regulator propeller domain-containing protein n=1 Tax=Ferruginibacter sp. TaxID=1940288 RepID=UPI00265A5876|nr:two-component regulator propeller domain-containing protein [Ferruginibacter sp.]MDB5276323.1 response regulator [Ferruginibacter sp.]